MAERAGSASISLAWGWQTFLLGFPSLGRLEQQIQKRERGE